MKSNGPFIDDAMAQSNEIGFLMPPKRMDRHAFRCLTALRGFKEANSCQFPFETRET